MARGRRLGRVWVLLGVVASGPAPARAGDAGHEQPSGKVMASASCAWGKERFEVSLRSPSGEEAEQDETLWISQDGQSLRVNPEGWLFHPARLASGESLCTGLAAVPLGREGVLLAFGYDLRPGCPGLALVLYEPQHRRVRRYDLVREPVSCEQPLQVRALPRGLAYLAVKTYRGDTVGSQGWREVELAGDTWVQRWVDPPATRGR